MNRGEAVGRWWLWPASFLAVAFLTAAACFGIYARLPPRQWDAGSWVGFPGPSDGDLSGHTMPGLVKAHPFFCGFWLLLCTALGSVAIANAELVSEGYSLPVGIVLGASVWWVFMLCFSRGWVKEGD
jgi:hypothetical protein